MCMTELPMIRVTTRSAIPGSFPYCSKEETHVVEDLLLVFCSVQYFVSVALVTIVSLPDYVGFSIPFAGSLIFYAQI